MKGAGVSPESTRKASPGKGGRAYCQKCGKPDADTRWDQRMKDEVFEPHSRFGGELYCSRSNRPVVQPKRPR
jgi:hypothetical protein